ncbi:MAG: hypothetical protein A2Y17_13005 [Clostridiales bacterium GWF2_38_85]|nr:MAG: hypothetical protein A2Y17_13005 [Clostridiales bacterium GWF2_38_85]HBL84177.1 hypothetical protein [Clostridiales bacterium]
MSNEFTDITSKSEAERLGRLYPIIIEKHNPKWKQYYEEEKAFLQEIFGDAVLRISHIGSTAVIGLMAKPTVDILLEIKESTDITAITEIMVDKGYVVNTPPKDIIVYLKGYGATGFEGQVFHIHVRNIGDHGELYFRDYLITHPETSKEYEKLKLTLKEKYAHDRDGYTDAKGKFIDRITNLARIEFKDKYNL